jgi:hypothetical protein
MSLLDLIDAELRTGLARLEGTRLSAEFPLRQRVIDELLRLLPGVPSNVSIAVGPDQHVQVRYGSVHANARLHPEVTLAPTPILTLTLSSQLIAFALGRLTLPPFVRLSGRDVTIQLAEIPACADLSGVWPHVEQIGIESAADGLAISVRLFVRAGGPPILLPTRRADSPARASAPSSPIGSWVQRQLDTGLPAFAGARASASVRAAVSLLNDLLAHGLAEAARGQTPSWGRTAGARPDLAMVARLIRQARVDAAPGIVTLDVEGGVDG